MSFNDTTANAAAAAARSATASAGTQNMNDLNALHPGTATASPAAGGDWDWADQGLSIPVSNVSTSEVLSKLELALAAIVKPDTGLTVRLLSVDNTLETNWRYSAAVLCVQRVATNWVGYLPMLVEATESAPLGGRTVRLGNSDRQVTVLQVSSDALSRSFLERIEQAVAAAFGNAEGLHVQGLVIPRTTNFDDTEQLKRILMNATRSVVNALAELDPKFIDMNLSRVSKAATVSSRLQVTSGAVNGDVINTVGLPVRQDVVLGLVATQPVPERNREQSQLAQAHELNGQGSAEEPIGAISGYIDTRFLPATPTYAAIQDPLLMSRRFVPELVITSVDLRKLQTVASMLMMISQITVLAEPRVLHSVMYQRMMNNRSDMKGVAFDPTYLGALNLFSNIEREATPDFYDLKSSGQGPTEFLDFVNRAFIPGLAISVDVPRLGPQAAYMQILTGCANGNPEALDFLLQSLNKLTGNKFSQAWFASTGGQGVLTAETVFSERNNSLYNGFYQQKVGDTSRQVDLRHVDTIALANRFGKQQPEMILKWAQSFMMNIDPAVRMANKREVIDAYTTDGATYTGISERHTFNTAFLRTIVECNIANRFQPVLEFRDPLAGADTGLQAPAFMGTGLSMGAVAGAFGSAGQQAQQFGGAYTNPSASRF